MKDLKTNKTKKINRQGQSAYIIKAPFSHFMKKKSVRLRMKWMGCTSPMECSGKMSDHRVRAHLNGSFSSRGPHHTRLKPEGGERTCLWRQEMIVGETTERTTGKDKPTQESS